MSLPALPVTADTRSITERVNVLIRDYNNQQLRVPTGLVLPFAGAAVPDGFLLCDGSAVNRATYAALFAAIGTTYGAGDGSTTFNLPDLRGRVVAGREAVATRLTAAVSGVDGAALGASGGNQNMHAHAHTLFSILQNVGSGIGLGGSGSWNLSSPSTTTSGTGNSQNVQPTIVLNYVIAT